MTVGLGLALSEPSPSLAAGARGGLRSVRVELAAVTELSAELSSRCRAQVLAELTEGRRRDEGCSQDREAAGRALVHRSDAFGFVERREVDLTELRLVLGVARRCRQWPLRSPGRDVLRRTDVDAAGCRLRRHQGEVSLVLIDRAGQRSEPLPPLRADRDGRVTLRFSTLDRDLRALGKGTLDGYARIELGDASWAGHVDLEQLLRFRADWHLTWLLRGRGTPGLFVVRHPEHPVANDVRTMAAEARLARQAKDYARVEAGELPPQELLDRYPYSLYGRRVAAWLRARASEARRLESPAAGSAAVDGTAPAPAPAPASAEPTAPGGGRRGGTRGGIGP